MADAAKVWQLSMDAKQSSVGNNSNMIKVTGPTVNGTISVVEQSDYESVKLDSAANRSDAVKLADLLRQANSVLLVGVLKTNVTTALASFDAGVRL